MAEPIDFVYHFVTEYIPVKLQMGRAAIRTYWQREPALHKDLDHRQIIDAILPHDILTEEDKEEVEGERSQVKASKLLLEKLILCRKPDVCDRFISALSMPGYGVTHLAKGLEQVYNKL